MKAKVNIVHFTSQPGGIEVIIPLMIENIKNVVFSSFVIRPPKQGERNIYDDQKISVSYGTMGRSSFWHLYKFARKNRNDIFHILNCGPIALLVLRLAGIKKLVYGIHGTIYWRNRSQQLIRKAAWKIAMRPDYIITSNSQFSGKIFKNSVLEQANPVLLYNPIDSERFKPGFKKDDSDTFKVVYSGRLANGKNLKKWILIASELFRKNPKMRFEVYGDGPQKDTLQKLIDDLMLNEIVKLKGYSKNPEEIYQNADVLLFLSEYESFGNVVIESIMCETPVIVSAIPSMLEVFQKFPEFLVPLDENLHHNIEAKLNQIGSLRQLTKVAAEDFRAKFSLKQHITNLESLYGSL
jgi:glycosyltransferase involved in cell wall biosynthesis